MLEELELMARGARFRIKGNRGGAAYVLALTTMLVGITLSLAMLRGAGGYFTAEDTRSKKQAALDLAEAGLDYAYWRVHYQDSCLPYSADVTLTTGSFHVDATDDGNRDKSTMLITSTGTCGKFKRTLKRVTLGPLPYYYTWCENAAADTDRLITSSGALGGIRTNNQVNLKNASTNVTTGVWAVSTITFKGSATPTYASGPPILFPDINYASYQSIATRQYLFNVTLLNPFTFSGNQIIYIQGNLAISGAYSGVFTIIATGDISIADSLWAASPSSHMALISNRHIRAEASATYVQAIMYCHDPGNTGEVRIKGAANTTVVGSMAGDTVVFDGPVSMRQDTTVDLTTMRQLHLPGL